MRVQRAVHAGRWISCMQRAFPTQIRHQQANVRQARTRRCVLGLEAIVSLAGPVVWYGPVQRDSVAEERVVAILLSQVLSIALLGHRQSCRKAALASTPEALDQTQRSGQTCARQTRSHVQRTHFGNQGQNKSPGSHLLKSGLRAHFCLCDCIFVDGSLIQVQYPSK